MPDAAAHLAARSRSRAGCDAHPPTDCPAREMADARYAGHRDPPDRAGALPESVPGNHLPQALRRARSSPGCGSRALRKQYGPGRTRRPGPRQPDSPSLPDAVHEYRHRFPEGIFQTSCDDAALHGGRIGDREVIGLITVKHASGKEERDGRPFGDRHFDLPRFVADLQDRGSGDPGYRIGNRRIVFIAYRYTGFAQKASWRSIPYSDSDPTG
mgnify:CR=1 FL=1